MNPIAKMLIEMARFYGYELEQRQSEMYVEILSGFPQDLVLQAGREYVTNLKNTKFPIPPHSIMADYLPQAHDPKDLGRDVALRVRHAVTQHGWCNSGDARAYIGEIGWSVVERMGGWLHICENLGTKLQESTVIAQVRDAAESHARYAPRTYRPAGAELDGGPRKPELPGGSDDAKQ